MAEYTQWVEAGDVVSFNDGPKVGMGELHVKGKVGAKKQTVGQQLTGGYLFLNQRMKEEKP